MGKFYFISKGSFESKNLSCNDFSFLPGALMNLLGPIFIKFMELIVLDPTKIMETFFFIGNLDGIKRYSRMFSV